MVYKNFRNILALIAIVIWLAVFSVDSNLHIIACDVGQGDAILIQKGNNQILIDGGPDNSVLSCLGKYMPFFDKTIELVILSHPEKDHYGGLIDVFKNYKVDTFASNGHESGSLDYQVLINEVGGGGIDSVTLIDGIVLRLGMIYLDILNPAGNNQIANSKLQKVNTNDMSVVILMKYAQFKALFTSDVENMVSDNLSENTKIQHIDYIKVNHHGSKNGLSEKLLEATVPKIAIISVGAKNTYGHPHSEILNLLEKYNIKILRTDQLGDVEIVSDGTNFW